MFTRDYGPPTKPRLVITALGGVKAAVSNPLSWTVDPLTGCIPWPSLSGGQDANSEAIREAGDNPPLVLPGTPPASQSEVEAYLERLRQETAPVPAPADLSVHIQPVKKKAATACPTGQVEVDLGNRKVCRSPWGR